MSGRRRGRGFSLIEAVVFIVVLAVLLAGLVVALSSELRTAPRAGEIDVAAELAQQRLELILAQRRSAGFAAFADPCVPGPGPAACTPPAGYTVSSSITTGYGAEPANYKVIRVDVTGTGDATASTIAGNY